MLIGWFDPGFESVYFEMLLLFSLALVILLIGFYRVLYFIDIGYAFTIAAMAIFTAVSLRQPLAYNCSRSKIVASLLLAGCTRGFGAP